MMVKARTGQANLKASEVDVHKSDFSLPWNLTTFLNQYYSVKVCCCIYMLLFIQGTSNVIFPEVAVYKVFTKHRNVEYDCTFNIL